MNLLLRKCLDMMSGVVDSCRVLRASPLARSFAADGFGGATAHSSAVRSAMPGCPSTPARHYCIFIANSV